MLIVLYLTACEVQMNLAFYSPIGLIMLVWSILFRTLYMTAIGQNKNEDYALIYKVNLHFYKKVDV